MNFFFIALIGFFAIPLIAWIDGLFLPNNFRCEYCNRMHSWTAWVMPSFLEIVLFLLGLAIGYWGFFL